MTLENLEKWVGKRETAVDVAAPGPVARLAATFDRDDPPPAPGDAVPAGWHWLYFLSVSPLSEAGPDGHPRRGGFLPPVELPRRMWAGSRFTWHRPIRIGEQIERVSEITGVEAKQGRRGPLVFVRVRHDFSGPDGLALSEDQTLVYREEPKPGEPPPPATKPPADAAWSRTITPDPVLLFRFSALTFNSHRIHYDQPYVTGEEGYPGLVVHGPLVALLLMDLLRRERPEATLTSFEFRALRPLFDTAPFTVNGAPDEAGTGCTLWALDPEGAVSMQATAEFAT